ncbi:hypothetical protein LINPERPRIM_LOCUS23137, partial [Linum perenne]
SSWSVLVLIHQTQRIIAIRHQASRYISHIHIIDVIQVTSTNNTQHPHSSSLGELLGAIRSLSR